MIPYSPFESFLGVFSTYKKDFLLRGSAPMVSISGGQDSIFLAWIVFHFQNERQLSPIWLYYNHLWHTEGFFHGVHSLRLAFIFGWPVLYTLPFHPVCDEELAWEFRQRLRRRLCTFYGTSEVLLGHTKTDQVESFLFHLFRGSMHPGSFWPEHRRFSSLPPVSTAVETTPSSLFALERLRVDWAPPTHFSSACDTVRMRSLF
jgi:tRNA(Ile)-lysidine synthase TilS/MesJ